MNFGWPCIEGVNSVSDIFQNFLKYVFLPLNWITHIWRWVPFLGGGSGLSYVNYVEERQGERGTPSTLTLAY